jgi:signal transduction histidine kinase
MTSPHSAPEPVNILLVDDHPQGLLALETTLSPLGQNLVKASSGREALRHLLKQDFALILLDVVMPELNGFETARLIRDRKSSRSIPIIFLTAMGDGEMPKLQAYSVGAVDYLIKPFEPEILRSKVSVFVELARTTDLLRTANAMLREANHAIVEQQLQVIRAEKLASLGVLSAGVAHEINNPLMGVMNCITLLRDGQLSADRRQSYFDAVSAALAHIESTVKALLGYARESPPQQVPLDVASLIGACAPLLAPMLNAKRLTLDVRVKPDEAIVWGNSSQLTQAVMNVLLNAVHASAAGEVITVSVVQSGEQIRIAFVDHGEGISEEHLRKVFDPFFTTKPQGEGTGLGLAVAQSIMQAHGGELSLASELGLGTTVTFTLRAAPHLTKDRTLAAAPSPVGNETISAVTESPTARASDGL